MNHDDIDGDEEELPQRVYATYVEHQIEHCLWRPGKLHGATEDDLDLCEKLEALIPIAVKAD